LGFVIWDLFVFFSPVLAGWCLLFGILNFCDLLFDISTENIYYQITLATTMVQPDKKDVIRLRLRRTTLNHFT